MSKKPIRTKRKQAGLISRLRGNFLTGLVIVLPVALTIWMIWAFIGFVDSSVLPLVPEGYKPSSGWRGYGVIVFLVFTTVVGSLTKGIFGKQLLKYIESLVDRMPIVRTIYNGVKQIVETVLNQSNTSFEKACMVEYPRRGIWAIAFVSTATKGEVLAKSGEEEMMSVFLPTTPNPTSGFLLFVPKQDVVILDMDVEAAAKLVISAGLVMPPTKEEIAAGKAKPRVINQK
ncbi:DUF502 domain-containing protein [Amylibacter sp. IMCC11727]|uniref:DUF502 domain-containing protein n=1 Tax=Amylibacter sp. IMCC11727 TaxID=3039851 RepID=UPI00244DBF0E|nr:DUF502 domain-containing protein [Amylibacter sp. IMCC11727]WGI20376.1 DUF502 domain-containing protein [Amylibacter sp. IMCC11727]